MVDAIFLNAFRATELFNHFSTVQPIVWTLFLRARTNISPLNLRLSLIFIEFSFFRNLFFVRMNTSKLLSLRRFFFLLHVFFLCETQNTFRCFHYYRFIFGIPKIHSHNFYHHHHHHHASRILQTNELNNKRVNISIHEYCPGATHFLSLSLGVCGFAIQLFIMHIPKRKSQKFYVTVIIIFHWACNLTEKEAT